MFTRSGSSWSQQGEKLTGGGESGAGYFGRSVALSADGDTALIGGYNDDEHEGAAWAFTRTGTTWTQQGAKLTGSGNPGFFGWSVALSSAATTALIGEWGVGDGTGAAFVFTRSGSAWSRQGEALTGPAGSALSWFGYSVALSGDGDTALIGAPHADGYAGDASVFSRTGSTWSTQGTPLSGAEEDGEGELGYSAALSRDGATALLGGRVDDGFHGAAWAFRRAGASGPRTGKADRQRGKRKPRRVRLERRASSAGTTALAGSPCDKACVGSVSAFVNAPEPPEFGSCRKLAPGSGPYANAGCTTSGGKQDYAWETGAPASGLTIGLSAGAAVIETVGGGKLACTGASGAGSYVGSKQLGGLVLTLSGCEHAGTSCSSAGAPAGEIVSGTLEGALGVEKLGAIASKDKLGLDLFPAGRTGPLMEFNCGAEAVSLRGSVIAPVKANKMAVRRRR